MSDYQARQNKLRKLLANPDAAILLTNEVNIGYFCGFFHSEGYLLITQEKTYLVVDFRYFEAAQKKSHACEVVCYQRLVEDLLSIFNRHMIREVLIEQNDLTVERFRYFREKFSEYGIDFHAGDALVKQIERLRLIKDADEIDKIQTAQQIAEKAYLELLNHIKPGVSERALAARLDYNMRLYGAEDISFDTIAITGKKTSLPHGVPSDDIIADGDFFTCDFGALYEGYHSDTTRTVAVGHATDEMRKIYQIVLDAQLAALEAIKPAANAFEVDKTARDIISEAGYGKFFGHSTGHGVGLNIHESPAVSPRGNAVLETGMVITDEPGIYLPDKFGVRIEDMLLVTEEGYRNFVTLPKELIIL